MCGISGIMHKKAGTDGLAPIGQELIKMLDAMKHRGMDSTGVTIAGEGYLEDLVLRIWSDPAGDFRDRFQQVNEVVSEKGGVIKTQESVNEYLRLRINYEGDISSLAAALYDLDGVEIHSIGNVSDVVKDVGSGIDLDDKHEVSNINGTHGIGHVRLATESRVDITHAHPFWAYPFPDVTVVHNGQLTIYHKLKRQYEDKGHRFQTENDLARRTQWGQSGERKYKGRKGYEKKDSRPEDPLVKHKEN